MEVGSGLIVKDGVVSLDPKVISGNYFTNSNTAISINVKNEPDSTYISTNPKMQCNVVDYSGGYSSVKCTAPSSMSTTGDETLDIRPPTMDSGKVLTADSGGGLKWASVKPDSTIYLPGGVLGDYKISLTDGTECSITNGNVTCNRETTCAYGVNSGSCVVQNGGMSMFMMIGFLVVAAVSAYVAGYIAPSSPIGHLMGRAKGLVGKETMEEKAKRLAPQARKELVEMTTRVAELRVKFEKSKKQKEVLVKSIGNLQLAFEEQARNGDKESAQRTFASINSYKEKLDRLAPMLEEQKTLIDQYMETIRQNRKQLEEVSGHVQHQAAMNELERMMTDLSSEADSLRNGGSNGTAIGELKALSGEIEGSILEQREVRKVRHELGFDAESHADVLRQQVEADLDFESAYASAIGSVEALPEPMERIQLGELNAVKVER